MIATLLGAVIGSVSLTGSIVAFGKLQGFIAPRPVKLPGQQIVTSLIAPGADRAWRSYVAAIVKQRAALPPVLWPGPAVRRRAGDAHRWCGHAGRHSLLNSYTGIAVAATGFVLNNYALLIAGTLVGASGVILTQLMTKAMNRSLFNVLFAGFGTGGGTAAVSAAGEESLREISADDAAVLMAYGKKVIIVPGYGMAVAQARARCGS